MPQRYKLRLGDGTVLMVDHGGLSTWAVDRKAMVQAEGSRQWVSLNEFLAAEWIESRRAARKKPTVSSREDLPLIPPPPRRTETPPPRAPAPPRTPPPSTPEPFALGSRPDPLPALAPPPALDAIAAEPAPATPPPPAPVSEAVFEPIKPAIGEPAGVEVLAADPRVSAQAQPAQTPKTAPPPPEPPRLEVRAEAAERPKPIPPPSPMPAPPPSTTPGPPPNARISIGRPEVRMRKPSLPVSRPDDSCPPIPLVPLEDEHEDEGRPIQLVPIDEEPPGAPAARSSVQVLAAAYPVRTRDESFRTPREGPESTGLPGQDLSIIPLKSLVEDSWTPTRGRSAATETEPEPPGLDGVADEVELQAFFRTPAGLTILRFAGAAGTFLSRGLDWLVPWLQRLWASTPRISLSLGRSSRGDHASAPAAESPLASAVALDPRAGAVAPDPPRTRAVAPEPAPAPRIERLPAVERPPVLEQLPVLRLAASAADEREEPEEIYEGESGPSLLAAAWRWTSRLALASVLVAGGIYAALTWETWFPKAGQLGNQAMTEIDRHARRLTRDEDRLVREASRELPHLAPDSVRLLLDRSPEEAPDTAALHRLASQASDGGMGALAASEKEELEALRSELLTALRRDQRDRLRDYDRARAIGATLPSDDRAALELVAAAARTLPAARLGRLQTLLGKAITAGLRSPLADEPAAP